MKTIVNSLAAVVAVGLLCGCDSPSPSTAVLQETPAVPAFSAKHGLSLPEQTRQSLGLRIIEVEERKLATRMDWTLRIFRVDRGIAAGTCSISPEQAERLKQGQAVTLISREGKALPGKVTCVNGYLREGTGLMEVLVEAQDPEGGFIPGAFVQASATLETPEAVLAIPRAALLETSEGAMVYAVSGEHLVRTPVKTGLNDGEYVEIKDGLYTGDQIALQPVKLLWMTELAAVKGGQSCCVEPPKGK